MAEGHGEIIIIKRHGDHEDGHHGGAWKIALADFMTAMMALFLVMWLINSTSKEQKQTIAEYFNPVKLAEVTHDRKGLRDPQDAPAEPGAEGGKAETKGEGKDARGTRGSDATGVPGGRTREFALFQDPYAVLARLAGDGERGAETSSADAAVLEQGQPGISGGEAARDPFDPLYWQLEALPGHRTEQPGAPDTVTAPPSDRRIDARERPPGKTADGKVANAKVSEAKVAEPKAPEIKAPEIKAAPRGRGREPATDVAKDVTRDPAALRLASAEPLALPVDAASGKEEARPDPKAAESAALAALKSEIAAAVQPLATGMPAPRIEVRRTGEGILISVTDDVNFSMFSVGSAEPMPKVVRALERIARVVATRPGRLVIRGHTDSRPFRSETYDNWRLSSARAQMASYMLVRGGVDEARFERIEGHADRQPRNAADTKAAENRRIEILLRAQPE